MVHLMLDCIKFAVIIHNLSPNHSVTKKFTSRASITAQRGHVFLALWLSKGNRYTEDYSILAVVAIYSSKLFLSQGKRKN